MCEFTRQMFIFYYHSNHAAEGFLCQSECFGSYPLGPETNCDDVNTALDCYTMNQEACDREIFVIGLLNQAYADYDYLNCDGQGNILTTNTATAEQPISCPTVPEVDISDVSVTMSRPEIEPPAGLSTLCTSPLTSTSLTQCSLFIDSQLRAFSNYRNGLETCSIPGKWYLLHHPSLTVEVEGVTMEPGSDHTRLAKINVTFYAHSCNMVARSYVAEVSSPLPSDFTPPITEPDGSTASLPLQLLPGSNGNVVTLFATWLNAVIIIRQYAGFLSVTIQVPNELSYESEGLCTGCPQHMYVNITHLNSQIVSTCGSDSFRAHEYCFNHGGVVNQDHLINVVNNSYFDACVYSLLRTNKSANVLSVYKAIADDAKLMHVTFVPDSTSSPTSSPSSTDISVTSIIEVSSSLSLLLSPSIVLLSFLLLVGL